MVCSTCKSPPHADPAPFNAAVDVRWRRLTRANSTRDGPVSLVGPLERRAVRARERHARRRRRARELAALVRQISPFGPLRRSSAARISCENGSDSSTSSIGASSSASDTENSPIVNSVSRSSGSALPAGISHIRARCRAIETSSCGASGIADIAITVAERRTVRVPSSVSASRTEPMFRGSAKNAELT
jgi:hypothetical protein